MRTRAALKASGTITAFLALALGLLVLVGCSSGGGGGNNAPGKWDQMNWNQDNWG